MLMFESHNTYHTCVEAMNVCDTVMFFRCQSEIERR